MITNIEDPAAVQVLHDYVARNLKISLEWELPSSTERINMSKVTGLRDKQLNQWFFQARQKCTPDLLKRFVIETLCGSSITESLSNSIAEARVGKIFKQQSAQYNVKREKSSLRHLGSEQDFNEFSPSTKQEGRSWQYPPFSEIQLATLEQSWRKGLIQDVSLRPSLEAITGVSLPRLEHWAENRACLGNLKLFIPKERHFSMLFDKLASTGILKSEICKCLANLMDISEKMIRDSILENARFSGLLFINENHDNIAGLMNIDVAEVRQLADESSCANLKSSPRTKAPKSRISVKRERAKKHRKPSASRKKAKSWDSQFVDEFPSAKIFNNDEDSILIKAYDRNLMTGGIAIPAKLALNYPQNVSTWFSK